MRRREPSSPPPLLRVVVHILLSPAGKIVLLRLLDTGSCEPGCSMCLAMNPDKLAPEERCASTSDRNFEGRQGFKGRTHLVSPAMAAAAAIAGHFVDIREWK